MWATASRRAGLRRAIDLCERVARAYLGGSLVTRAPMVAYDPHIPADSPSLPGETVARLREALRDALAQRTIRHDGARPDAAIAADAALCEALAAASRDARERTVRPEVLIVLLKRLEEELAEGDAFLRRVPAEDRRKLREWVVTTCVRTYFDH